MSTDKIKLDKNWHPESAPDRLTALSDGIFSVSLTLAAVEIMPPELGHRLAVEGVMKVLHELAPSLIGVAMNFFLVSNYWVAHHRIFTYVRRIDYAFIMRNMLFLMFITFMPFAIKVQFSGDTAAAVSFYSGFMAFTGLLLIWVWDYATRKHRLVDPKLDPRVIRYGYVRSVIGIAIYLVAIGVAQFSPKGAQFTWCLFFFHRRLAEYVVGSKPDEAINAAS
jgi:uncharacterized membrane protein